MTTWDDGTSSTRVASALEASILTEVRRPVFDVKRPPYNAVGNGATDDTTAINAAITACLAAGGGTVYFPPGTYICNSLVIAGNNVTLQGAGMYASTLRQVASASDNTYLVSATNPNSSPQSTTSSNRYNLNFYDMQFQGRSDTDTTTQYVHLMAFTGVSDVNIERCLFYRNRGDAIYMGSGLSSPGEWHNERIRIRNCIFDGGGTDNNRNCITLIDGTDVWITDNVFRDAVSTSMPGAIDLEPNGTVYPRFRNIHIERNVFDDIKGNAGVIGMIFNEQQADLTTPMQGLFINDNVFRNCTPSSGHIYLAMYQTPTDTTTPNNVEVMRNHIVAGANTTMEFNGLRGVRCMDNYAGYNGDVAGLSLGWSYRIMDVRVQGNRFHRIGTSASETGINIGSVSRAQIQDNQFDNIDLLLYFVNNAGSSSSSIDLIDNMTLGSTVSGIGYKDGSHTLTNGASDNRAWGNKWYTGIYTEPAVFSGTRAWRTILDSSGSHIAARVAGTYGLPQGEAAAISGTGTLYPLNVIYLDDADYPHRDGYQTKLRIRAQVNVNDVAPTGNYTFGLHPVTRPGTSGGAGLDIYTIGAAATGSNGAVFTAPAADSSGQQVSAEFNIPADGQYVLGFVSTATVAASSHLHISAQLQVLDTA